MAPSDATVRVTANRLDSRLRLPACQAEPESFVPAGRSGMPTSIGVRCTVGPAWSMYVPVRVELITNVVVLRNPGARGERLTADQLGLEARDVSRMTNGYLSEIDAVAGMVLRRQVQPGTVLTSALIEKEKIVRRGEQVRLQMGGGVFAVSVTGEALADAASGERVRIRNTDSGRVIEGIAEAPGLVRIGM
jgi:flagella basal body P-ring formation protein FlgA